MVKHMEPHDFKKWRKYLGFSQKDAAEALGLKRRMIQYYESGERDGEAVKIPASVALACFAVAEGVLSYRGPSKKIEWRDVNDHPVRRLAVRDDAPAKQEAE